MTPRPMATHKSGRVKRSDLATSFLISLALQTTQHAFNSMILTQNKAEAETHQNVRSLKKTSNIFIMGQKQKYTTENLSSLSN